MEVNKRRTQLWLSEEFFIAQLKYFLFKISVTVYLLARLFCDKIFHFYCLIAGSFVG